MGNEWRIFKIGELGKVVTGKTPSTKKPEYFTGQYPFITIPDMGSSVFVSETTRTLSEAGAEVMKSCRLPKNSVMMSCIATIGKCGITTKDSFTNQQINSVICDQEKVNSLYLYYVFTQLRQVLDAAGGGGSVYTNVSKSRFSNIPVTLPSLTNQRSIAHILGSLDDKIELNRQMNRTLEAMAQAIFKSWFVDFDPVVWNAVKAGKPVPARFAETAARYKADLSAVASAKAEGRNLCLPKKIADLFPDSFEDSELGEIPNGWKAGLILDLGEVICGKTPPTKDSDNYGEKVPFITIPDMHEKVFVTQTGKCLSTQGAKTQPKKFLPPKSICVSCIATPGLVILTSEKSQTNQQINSVIPEDYLSPYYCFQLLRRLGDQIRAGGSGGSVLLNLNKTQFSKIKILLAEQRAIEAYHKLVEPLFDRLLSNERESATLASLRDTLLPKLISGELHLPAAALELTAQADVPDAENFVEEARG